MHVNAGTFSSETISIIYSNASKHKKKEKKRRTKSEPFKLFVIF